MPRVLLSGKLHDDGMAVLRARHDVTVVQMTGEDPAEFVAKLPEADALLIRTALLPREALVNAGRLKVVSRHGVGYDNVPVDALTEKGVPLAVVGGIHSGTVAEHAMFLMLALAKAALRHDRAVRAGEWNHGAGEARGVRTRRADAAPHRIRPHRASAIGPRPRLRDEGHRLRSQRS